MTNISETKVDSMEPKLIPTKKNFIQGFSLMTLILLVDLIIGTFLSPSSWSIYIESIGIIPAILITLALSIIFILLAGSILAFALCWSYYLYKDVRRKVE